MSKELKEYLTESEKREFNQRIRKLDDELYHSGWQKNPKVAYENESAWQFTILSDEYECLITINVSDSFESLRSSGELGIWNIEVKHEHQREETGLSGKADIQDLLDGLKYAENLLVKLGIPFWSDHNFVDESNKLKNMQNRYIWKLNEIEKFYDLAYQRKNQEDIKNCEYRMMSLLYRLGYSVDECGNILIQTDSKEDVETFNKIFAKFKSNL